ncbi:LysR family transcriptional regulator [Candidatus Symbiopectobacterium sp. NZEC151]|uniref:LysR family transcriptional regulator n=2 Tax=Symbiopectobacterium TaxID=801 RepID=UPI0022277095|nr:MULTISPECIES: LysR family transcriptional regulator [unclassified Symbiopectobacterium]MCW2475800.1 LysR family transcriptional regulator [Candidatus Symbiopectobacterium sp. NZEC151]MCW2481996.1 LysR family transcriptional regulator [Candidatus Symbiopectobacterium sp. NZEC135]MCW2486017.1 LysR family transcriptional regulator [Candidatus Symbiopectobacterium sp. NZEC127]
MPAKTPTTLTRSDLADLNAFLITERMRSFTKAAVELGITTSALSHSIRNLETRLGVRLLNRTSRTVSPTEAGTTLALRLTTGFREIGDALEEINLMRDRPVGRLRLNVLSDGARLVIARHLPRFISKYPDVEVEISVDDRMVDIVSEGFDAGIRFGGTVPEDLVAVRLGGELTWVAVASPRYLYQHTPPSIPEDLRLHDCIQMRTGQGIIYRWEFRRKEDYRVVDVTGPVCVSETALAIELALSGVGIAYCLKDRVRDYIRDGSLRVVLPEWSPIEPPMYLYYPGHRRLPQGLKELIEVLHEEITHTDRKG